MTRPTQVRLDPDTVALVDRARAAWAARVDAPAPSREAWCRRRLTADAMRELEQAAPETRRPR